MKKRIIALLLVVAMVFTLAACGVDSGQVYKFKGKSDIAGFGTVNGKGDLATVSGVNFEFSLMNDGTQKKEFASGAVGYLYTVTSFSSGQTVVDNYQTYLENKVGLTKNFELTDITGAISKIDDFIKKYNIDIPALKTLFNNIKSAVNSASKINVTIYSDNADITQATQVFVIGEYAVGASEFVLIIPSATEAVSAITNIFAKFFPKKD